MDDDDSISSRINAMLFDPGSEIGFEQLVVIVVVIGFGMATWIWLAKRRTAQASAADVAGFFPRKRRRRRSRRG